MIILRAKKFTYTGVGYDDERTHLLMSIREEIYNSPGILSDIREDANNLGLDRENFIRELGISLYEHIDPDTIQLELKHPMSDKVLSGFITDDDNIVLNKYE